MLKKLREALGISKNSDYIRDFFYRENMKSSIYMSVIILVLELWMIARMTRIIIRDHLQDDFAFFFLVRLSVDDFVFFLFSHMLTSFCIIMHN